MGKPILRQESESADKKRVKDEEIREGTLASNGIRCKVRVCCGLIYILQIRSACSRH